MKTELQAAADKLVLEIFGVKAGETVVLTADYESNGNVLRAVSDSVREAGAAVMVITVPPPGSVGKPTLLPGGQDAVSHSDGICLNSSVWLDGVQIMDEGKIVLQELAELMPEASR